MQPRSLQKSNGSFSCGQLPAKQSPERQSLPPRRPSYDRLPRSASTEQFEERRSLRHECDAHREEVARLAAVIQAAEDDLRQLNRSPSTSSVHSRQDASGRELPLNQHSARGGRRASAPEANVEALKVLERRRLREVQTRRSNSAERSPAKSTPQLPHTSYSVEDEVQSESTEGAALSVHTWTMVIDHTSGEPLGVDLAARGSQLLEIESIREGRLFDAWNRLHPSQAVRAGDRILEVNGESDVTRMVTLCQQRQPLFIVVGREVNNSAPAVAEFHVANSNGTATVNDSQAEAGTGTEQERCAILERKLKASRDIANACRHVLMPFAQEIFPGCSDEELSPEEDVVWQFLRNGIS